NMVILPLISVIESLFALGKNRQALHDKLAKTKVVQK
ncbi:MAG: RDD family protein, partial [Acinetobacter sp.]